MAHAAPVAEAEEGKGWSYLELIKEAKARTADWPIPIKPKTPLDQLHIPEDIDSLNSITLANLSIRLQSWHAYISTELAFVKGEYTVFLELFEIKLGKAMYYTSKNMDGRPVKEVVKGITLEDPELAKLHGVKLKLELRVINIEGLMNGVAIQCRALAGEQIRRASLRKIEGV